MYDINYQAQEKSKDKALKEVVEILKDSIGKLEKLLDADWENNTFLYISSGSNSDCFKLPTL